MIAILLVAASLLTTQAYLFRDIEDSESNREVPVLNRYRAEALEAATNRWPAETDSSRSDDSMADR